MSNKKVFSIIYRVGVVLAILMLAASPVSAATTPAQHPAKDVVVIPPTAPSNTPEQKQLNSIATLNAFQEAIDGTPPGGRVIQLQPGLYDFSANVISANGSTIPPPNFTYSPESDVFFYNPLNLTNLGGTGVAILGQQNLTLRGAAPVKGEPVSIIRGCTDEACWNGDNPTWFNEAFFIAGYYDRPARFVTFEQIWFDAFTWGFYPDSDASVIPPGFSWPDPRIGVGTEDLHIQNNKFTNIAESIVAGGQHVRMVIKGNHSIYTGTPVVHFGHVTLGGYTPDRHPIDTLVEGNTFEGGSEGVRIWNEQVGTTIRNNTIMDAWFGVEITEGTHQVYIPLEPGSRDVVEKNTITGAGGGGIVLWNGSNWLVRNNMVHNSGYGVWTEWGPFNYAPLGIIRLIPAENNVISNNDLSNNLTGVFIGANSRNNIYAANNVSHSKDASYFLNGPEEFIDESDNNRTVNFGPPSGNTIIGLPTKKGEKITLIDNSGCHPGPGRCPQLDNDQDGRINEDDIDGINNDNDLTPDGLAFIDEDPAEIPNLISGFQVIRYPPISPLRPEGAPAKTTQEPAKPAGLCGSRVNLDRLPEGNWKMCR